MGRTGWAATVAFFASGTILAVFQVQGEKMPEPLASLLIIIMIIMGSISVVIVAQDVIPRIVAPIRHRRLRSPIYDLNAAHPLQWLLNIADAQRDNPTAHLVITDRIVMDFNRDAKRPRLRIRLYYRNLGVHNLMVSDPVGYPYYQSERLPDLIQDRGGTHNVPVDGSLQFDLEVFIPEQFLKDICSELDSPTGEIRQLSLSDLHARVRVNEDGSKETGWTLGDQRMIIRPNR